jgi:hypothetical protein
MAETTADVRRDIELTRERMSSTIDELERKLNVTQMIKEHPWPAIALAVGAGVLLSGSKTDVKAAAATVAATKGASSKLGTALDDVVADLVNTFQGAFHGHVDRLVDEIKDMIGAPQQGTRSRVSRASNASNTSGYGVGPMDISPEPVSSATGEIPRGD